MANKQRKTMRRHTSCGDEGRSSRKGSTVFVERNKSGLCISSSNQPRGCMRVTTLDESLHSTYGQRGRSHSESSVDRSISWHKIEIREYVRAVSDNPSCSSGPPIGIGWEYAPEEVISIDEYEKSRPPRRDHCEMVLPRDVRQEMLKKEWGVPQSQIASAIRSTIRAKNQRRQTVQNLGKMTKVEEAMESAGRKLKRFVLRRKSDTIQAEMWRREAERAAAAIKEMNALEEEAERKAAKADTGTVLTVSSMEENPALEGPVETLSNSSNEEKQEETGVEFPLSEADKAASARRGSNTPIVCEEESSGSDEEESERLNFKLYGRSDTVEDYAAKQTSINS